jgi:hypothetical protein
MSTQQARRQMPAQAGRTVAARGEAAREAVSDEACGSRHETKTTGSALLHAALTRENLPQALKRAQSSADGGTAADLSAGLERLLPIGANASGLAGAGRVVAPSVAGTST